MSAALPTAATAPGQSIRHARPDRCAVVFAALLACSTVIVQALLAPAAFAAEEKTEDPISRRLGEDLKERYAKALEFGNIGDLPYPQVEEKLARKIIENGTNVFALYTLPVHSLNRHGYAYYLMQVNSGDGMQTYYILGHGGISGAHSIVMGPVKRIGPP